MAARAACALLAVWLLLPGGARSAEPVAVIASPGWPLREIPLTELRRIYLGSRTRLGPVRLERFHLAAGSAAREGFSLTVLGRSETALQDYWIEQALTGGRLPPRELRTPAEVVEAVARRVGALGYVPLGSLDADSRSRVRIVRVVDGGRSLAPLDARYPIRVREPRAEAGGG